MDYTKLFLALEDLDKSGDNIIYEIGQFVSKYRKAHQLAMKIEDRNIQFEVVDYLDDMMSKLLDCKAMLDDSTIADQVAEIIKQGR